MPEAPSAPPTGPPLSDADKAADAKLAHAATLAAAGAFHRPCPVVTLTRDEMQRAVIIGCRRNYASLLRGHAPRGGGESRKKESFWGYHIEGAGAELAVALLFNIPWSASVNTFRDEPDVTIHGHGYEVRLNMQAPELRVRPVDDDALSLIAVYGIMPNYTVIGWAPRAGDLKRASWLRNPGNRWPVYQIPYADLADVLDLMPTPDLLRVMGDRHFVERP